MQNNPNQRRQSINTNPNQQQQEMDKLGQEQNRDINIQEDKVVVRTDINTVLAPEHVVQRYNKVVNQVRQTDQSVEAYDDKLEEVLDEYNEEMAVLHTLVDDHPQDDPDNLPSSENLVNRLSSVDLQRFNNLQELKSQTNQMLEKISNGLDDIEDLHRAAKAMADRHGHELEADTVEDVTDNLYVIQEDRLER